MGAKDLIRFQLRAFSLSVTVLLGFGCLKNLDVAKIQCTTDNQCPEGYQCAGASAGKKGSCCQGTACGVMGDAGANREVFWNNPQSLDAFNDVRPDVPQAVLDSDRTHAIEATADGQVLPSPTDTLLNPNSKANNGEACTSGSDCPQGHCVEKICCDKPCSETCFSCKQSLTGKSDGTCAPVGNGKKDPQNTCTDETAKSECGNDGFCDGAGACRKVTTDHVCKTSSCAGTLFSPISTCDGKGECKPAETINCGTSQCDATDGCRNSCAAATDCSGAAYCNPVTGKCAVKKIDGENCSQAMECGSGFCVDGVCCKTACTGRCKACSITLTGQASGTCSAAKAGTDPHQHCEEEPGCGNDGWCDGSETGDCRKRGSDTLCSTATCSNDNKYTFPATCNGKGACQTPKVQDCAGILCSEEKGCPTDCSPSAPCADGNYCNRGTCSPKLGLGKACNSAIECSSGNCVEGICCNEKCDGACFSCKNERTDKADGTCAAVKNNTKDSKNSCLDERSSKLCGQDGTCDGLGKCSKVDKGTVCGEASCSSDLKSYTHAATCNGSGTCSPPAVDSCGGYQCKMPGGCQTKCTSHGDCSSSMYCSPTGDCTAKGANGAPCDNDGNACLSGKCVDGVCCNTACTGQCQACAEPNKVGTCTTVTGVPRGGRPACSGTVATCAGRCGGSLPNECSYPTSETVCSEATCSSELEMKTASVCNGAGACTASKAVSCGSGKYCTGGACVPKVANGGPCQNNNQCNSGNCTNNLCCATGLTACGGTCVSLSNNNANCGACSRSCATGSTCSGGSCYLANGQACTSGSQCLSGVCTTFYSDSDEDGFGTTASIQQCGTTPPKKYATNASDCCDSDLNAKPGQSAFYPAANKCGKWDYNCDSQETKKSNGPTNCGTAICADVDGVCTYMGGCTCAGANPCASYSIVNCGQPYYVSFTYCYVSSSCGTGSNGAAAGTQECN